MPLAQQNRMDQLRGHARRLGIRRAREKPLPPTNFQLRDASPEAIEADAAYGLNTGLAFYNQMRGVGIDPADKRVLEIGPGTGFASVAVLTAFGARGAVADRWLSPWQVDYHGPYYRRLAKLLAHARPDADTRPIAAMAEKGNYDDSVIELIPTAAEALHTATRLRFDAVFSNAVLEHLSDIDQSLRALRAVTSDKGYGFHQVDFRDHRNFDRPLDHLLFDERTFTKMSERVHLAHGSQHRMERYVRAFEQAGFAITAYHSNATASEDYLDELIPKLARAFGSPYRKSPREVLRDLGGLFIAQRASPEA